MKLRKDVEGETSHTITMKKEGRNVFFFSWLKSKNRRCFLKKVTNTVIATKYNYGNKKERINGIWYEKRLSYFGKNAKTA